MPIKDPLPEGMPRRRENAGHPPSDNDFVAAAIARVWYEIETGQRDPITVPIEIGKYGPDRRPLAIPEAGPYRASNAGTRCDRAAYYQLAGTPVTNPPTLADMWRMATGTIIHDVLEAIAEIMFEENDQVTNVRVEPKVDLRNVKIPGSGSGDIVMEYDGVGTAVEVKTVGGFKYKLAATSFNGPPKGPDYGHIVQGLIAALAQGLERLVIVYVAMENVSVEQAEKMGLTDTQRFAAEWHFDVTRLNELLGAEQDRVAELLEAVERNDADPETTVLPPRELRTSEVPAGAIVQSTRTGAWTVVGADGDTIVDTGKTWMCGYCRHRDQCEKDGA